MDTLILQIKRDIRAFADPGSDVLVDNDLICWEQDGSERTATLVGVAGGGLPDVEIEGARLTYRSFLAGPQMANLDRLAEFMPKIISKPRNYVSTKASTREHGVGPADVLIRELALGRLRFGSTRIVLVQGEAGSGKTIALKRMTLDRARDWQRQANSPLFFYIDVQGRALSRLDDAMARDLQDLRSRFYYNAVPSLVRNGLLVPVIDGFDELLGTGGYEDAFSSLAAFIAQLDGCGALVASARSAFFDYNGFRENAERYSGDGMLSYDIEPVKIEPWSDQDAEELVRKRTPDPAQLASFRQLRTDMDDENRKLLRKPFYVSQIVNLLLDGDGIHSDDMILDKLVETFIRREHAKLRNKEGRPLLSLQGHREFLVRLAEEMWWLETRHLDVETVQAWLELVVEQLGVAEDDARQIRSRVPTYGFLTTVDAQKGTLRFEHEVFYGFLLAEKLKQCIDHDPRELRRFLNRSMLDETLVDQVVRLLGDEENAVTAVDVVCSVLTRGLTESIARQNGGRLVARIIKEFGRLRVDATMQHLYFEHEDFGEAELERPHFANCYFSSVDLTRTRMHRPRFTDCMFHQPRVAMGYTLFDGAPSNLGTLVKGIAVVNEGIEHDSETNLVYAPERITSILCQLGMERPRKEEPEEDWAYLEVQKGRIATLERFLGKMAQRYRLAKDDLERLGVTNEENWDLVYCLLERHGLLKEEMRQMSGRPKPLIRLAYPPDVIRMGENLTDVRRPKLTAFWKELLAG